MKKWLISSLLMLPLLAQAQLFDGIETLLLAKEDAEILLQGYTQPLGKSLIYGQNTGWAHTAKTHKPLGFDLTIGAGVSLVSDLDVRFMPQGLRFTEVPQNGLPTLFGEAQSQALAVRIPTGNNTPDLEADLDFPGGAASDLPVQGMPTPTVQLSVGAWFNTDITVRFVPEINLEGTNLGLWGLGLKHDLTQYLGPLDRLPLNVSVLAARSQMDIRYDLPDAGAGTYVDFTMSTYTLQVLGSLDFPIISVYGAVGYSGGSAELGMIGSYDLTYTQNIGGLDVSRSEQIKDPIQLGYKAHSALGTLGLRVNLPLIKIYGQYSLQEYQTASLGVALSVR
jgi:hypothetical protein